MTHTTTTIQINGKYFKVSSKTMADIESLVETLYGTCKEPYLSELNELLGKVVFNNPQTDLEEGLVNFEYIF